MKTKTLLILVTLGLFLAGCASTQQAGGNARPTSTAADFVRALDGKAKANGATVTLTGEALIEKDIAVPTGITFEVPEGITLDLTADRARLRLLGGATLTVNGTVNARGHGDQGKGWVEGSIRIEDGTSVINGNGTINLKGKGQLLNIYGGGKGQKLTLDGVTLVGVKDNNRSLVDVNNGGEFILKSGAIIGNTAIGGDWPSGGGVSVHKATFTMEGGEISGNATQGGEGSNGGGVNIGEGSVFIMKSGAIIGNTAIGGKEWAGGGGVSVYKAMFTMEGGEISGNTTQGGEGSSGGGVGINEGSVFTMKSGEISGNVVQNVGHSNGGGVDVYKATFTMSGGEISGNRTSSDERHSMGGGVFLDHVVFVMTGGKISGNTSITGNEWGGGGGGVTILGRDSVFTMKGGVISGNSAVAVHRYGGAGGGLWARGGAFILEGGTIYGDVNSLPAGTDASLANTSRNGASMQEAVGTAKWGTGGTYTKGGVSQTGGSNIIQDRKDPLNTDDTLIAVPAR